MCLHTDIEGISPCQNFLDVPCFPPEAARPLPRLRWVGLLVAAGPVGDDPLIVAVIEFIGVCNPV